MPFVDLHTHSVFSDGSMTPEEILDLAAAKGLSAIAITDHDDIGAAEQAVPYAKKKSIEFITGVELSIEADLPGRGHLHLLGYLLDTENDALNEALDWLKAARITRAAAILGKLRDLGIDIDMTELEATVGRGSAGRPHIAQMLISKKVVRDVWEAFSVYLSKGRPAHVPKQKLDLKSAIDLIHGAGGVAVLAHPVSLMYTTYQQYDRHLQELVGLGLDGLEVYYYSQDREFRAWLLRFCRDNGLVATGGSDFHGDRKPNIELGTGTGNLKVPAGVVQDLKAYHEERVKKKD